MTFLTNLIPTLLILGLLILIHELGHFIACRLTKVRVEKFSIGFGPELFHFQAKETRYVLSLLPIGGYVKPAGETLSGIGSEGPQPHDYLAASVGKRIVIVVSGVFMNYLLSFVLFTAIYLLGRPIPLAQIGGFVKGYPAETAGLQKGDRVLAVDRVQVTYWEDLIQVLGGIRGERVRLEVLRGGERKELEIPFRREAVEDIFGKPRLLPRLGIMPDPKAYEMERLGLLPAFAEAFSTEVHLTAMTYQALYYLAIGELSFKTVSGPLGIIAMTGTAAQMGVIYLLHLTAVLGISLAVINLLPIPALDGGHLFFLLVEAIQGKGVSFQFQERAAQVGFALLIALMVFVFYNDLVNLQLFDRVKAVLAR